MAGSRWTPEKLEIAKRYLDRGLTGTASARAFWEDHGLTVTRNMIIGIWNRQGWEVPRSPRAQLTDAEKLRRVAIYNERRRQQYSENNQFRRKSRIQVTEELRQADVVPLHIAFDDLTTNTCKFPYGDGPFTFCGCEPLQGRSYCGPHQAISYNAVTMTQEEFAVHKQAYRRKMIAEVVA